MQRSMMPELQVVEMKFCSNCVLPDTFPGIRFNEKGICNYCQRFMENQKRLEADKKKYKGKFRDLLNQVTSKSPGQLSHPYDVIMAYSGGKDSTYTLKVLKDEFQLNILAITFNHGFVSPQALSNIHTITTVLHIDHMMFTPNQKMLSNAFRESIRFNPYPMKAMERASAVCTTCMNLVKSYLLKMAIEMGIPLIAYGWSPGQAPVQSSVLKLNPSLLRQMQGIVFRTLNKIMGEELGVFTLNERHYYLLERESGYRGRAFLYNINPLAFFDYSEERAIEEAKKLGWRLPKDTDASSTNCLLNTLANRVHIDQFGFHPSAFEIAGLVRRGYMARDTGLARLLEPQDENMINYVKEKLGLQL